MGEWQKRGGLLGAAAVLALAQDGPSAGATTPAPVRRPAVGIFVKFEKRSHEGALTPLRKAVNRIFRPTGVDLRWHILDPDVRQPQSDRVVIVEMLGSCTPWRNDYMAAEPERRPLGWTRLEDGEVMPFATVDCDQIALALLAEPRRTPNHEAIHGKYWNLMARVLAHELMHALLRTAEHFGTDCTRSPLRAYGLYVPAQLQPSEVAALRQLGVRSRGDALADGKPRATDKRPASGQ